MSTPTTTTKKPRSNVARALDVYEALTSARVPRPLVWHAALSGYLRGVMLASAQPRVSRRDLATIATLADHTVLRAAMLRVHLAAHGLPVESGPYILLTTELS
jgi:hypothetical protein